MGNTLENYSGAVKVTGREIKNLQFGDELDLVADTKEELVDLITRLDTAGRNYGMEISAEKSKTPVT